MYIIMSVYIWVLCILLSFIAIKAFSFTSLTRKKGTLKCNQRSFTTTSSSRSGSYSYSYRSNGKIRFTNSLRSHTSLKATEEEQIISPFDRVDNDNDDDEWESDLGDGDFDNDLSLTADNVEMVLDEMRPYLKADGGDVALAEIDGPIVKLELQGACGTCPSSSMTMKMGLERRLKERIPEIAEVIQSIPEAPELTEAEVDTVLNTVRPFLAVAGGKISLDSITGIGGLQPCITLKMDGSATSLQSVKVEIMQRIQRHFLQSLRIEWI